MADARIVVEVIGDISKLKSALGEVESTTRSAFSKIEGLGKTLSTAVTAPLAALGTAAIHSAMEFNAAMANVAALIPGNIERIQELKASVQELAKETGESTSDLARGLYEVISAFGDSSESIEKLEIAVKAAKAGAADTVDAVRMLSAVMKGYGDTSAEAMQKVADFSLMVVKLGQTTFPELADALDRVVPIASTLGISLEELHTVFATLTGVTGNAAEVATQFRAILGEFLKPSKDLAKVIAEMGYESGPEFVKAMRGVVPAIKALYKHVDKNEAAFSALFGRIEGINAALALVGPQAETFSEKLEQMGQAAGFTEEAFKAQTQGINAAGFTWERFKAKLQVFMQEVGDKLLPVFARFLDKVSALFDWFSKLSPRLQNFLITLAGAAAASGPIMMAVGAIGQATSAFSTFASLFAAGGALGPYGLVAIGVGAVALLIYQNWDKIKDFLLNCWNTIRSTAESIWGGIKGFFSNFWDGLTEYHRITMEAWQSFFSSAWEKIKGVAETVWVGIKSFFLRVWEGVSDYHQASMEQTHSILSSIWEKTKGVAETIWGGIKSFFLRVWEGVNDYHEASMKQTNAVLMTSWKLIKSGAETVWGGIKSFFIGFWDTIKSNWETAWSGIRGFLESAWESISEKATKAWDTIKEGAKSLWERLVGHSIIPDMVDAVNEEFKRIDPSPAIERFSEMGEHFRAVAEGIVFGTRAMAAEVNKSFRSIDVSSATAQITTLGTQFSATAEGIKQSSNEISRKIEELSEKVVNFIGQVGNIVIGMRFGERPTPGQFGNIFTGILSFFSGIPGWIISAIQTVFKWIEAIRRRTQELINEVAQGLSSAIQAAFAKETWEDALQVFGERLHEFIYQYIVEAMIKAFLASSIVQEAMKEFATAINQAIQQSIVNGMFDPEKFSELAQPALEKFAEFWKNVGLQALEELFDKAKDLARYIQSSVSSISVPSSPSTAPSTPPSSSSCPLSGSGSVPRVSFSAASVAPKKPPAWKEIAEDIASSIKNGISRALSDSLDSFEEFIKKVKERFRESIMKSIIDGVVEGFIKATLLKKQLEQLAKAIKKALWAAFAGGVFNQQVFESIVGPAIAQFIQAFQNTLPALEAMYNYIFSLFSSISASLGIVEEQEQVQEQEQVTPEIIYHPVEVTPVVSVPVEEPRAMQIMIQNTFISPEPLDEREIRRQLELFMRMLSYEVGLV